MAAKVRGSSIPSVAQAHPVVAARGLSKKVELFKGVNHAIEKVLHFSIDALPRQRLIITDVPKETYEMMDKVAQEKGDPLEIFKKVLDSHSIRIWHGHADLVCERSEGAIVLSSAVGLQISLEQTSGKKEGKSESKKA